MGKELFFNARSTESLPTPEGPEITIIRETFSRIAKSTEILFKSALFIRKDLV
jgi:hypothetical protein